MQPWTHSQAGCHLGVRGLHQHRLAPHRQQAAGGAWAWHRHMQAVAGRAVLVQHKAVSCRHAPASPGRQQHGMPMRMRSAAPRSSVQVASESALVTLTEPAAVHCTPSRQRLPVGLLVQASSPRTPSGAAAAARAPCCCPGGAPGPAAAAACTPRWTPCTHSKLAQEGDLLQPALCTEWGSLLDPGPVAGRHASDLW